MAKITTGIIIIIMFLTSGCIPSTERVEKNLEDGTTLVYNLKGGIRNGSYESFYKNKQTKSRMTYVDGVIDGKAYYFDSLGNKEAIEFFDKGELRKVIQYHSNGKVFVSAGMLSNYNNGAYFQMKEDGDTIMVAMYDKDTTLYSKVYDQDDWKVLDYYLDYQLSVIDNGDSLKVEIFHPSPDPNLKWKFALGEFSDVAMNNDEYKNHFIELKKKKTNIGSFTIAKTSVDDKIKGVILEYDMKTKVTFSTRIEEDIE